VTTLDYFGLVLLALSALGVTCDVAEHRRITRGRLDITEAQRRNRV